jgi:hypothetical protein
MHFSEDDLRSALKRKDPGEAFTQRVMAKIHQAEFTASAPQRRRWFLPPMWWASRLRLSVAGVCVALLSVGGWLGIEHYRHVQETLAEEHARQQAILALRITTSKLNHVFQRVKVSPAHEVKIRREQL